MSKTAMIRARIEPSLKKEVEKLFHRLGLTATAAINLFYRQVKLIKGLPFQVKIPNKTTFKTFEKTDQGLDLIHYKNLKDMFRNREPKKRKLDVPLSRREVASSFFVRRKDSSQ